MQWVIIIGAGIIWLIVSIINGASDAVGNVKLQKINKDKFNNSRMEKYPNRIIDASKNIFDRNQDIIDNFIIKVVAYPKENSYYSRRYSYQNYYFDNLTRDCLNEICLAENNFSVYPDTSYLSDWIKSAPVEWVKLSEKIKKIFEEKQEKLITEERERAREIEMVKRLEEQHQQEIKREKSRADTLVKSLRSKKYQRTNPLSLQKVNKIKKETDMDIDEISLILTPNLTVWTQKEKELLYPSKKDIIQYPLFTSSLDFDFKYVNDEIEDFNRTMKVDEELRMQNKDFFTKIFDGYKKGKKEDVISRINFIMNDLVLPKSIPNNWDVDFSDEEGIAIVEVMLPDVVHRQSYKMVSLKSGKVKKPLTKKETEEKVPMIHPSIALRIAYEIFRNDISDVIKLLVINGWVEFDNPATGLKTKTYTVSLVVEKDKIKDLNLTKLDPLSAFASLKGKSAGKLIDIIPISPVMSLDKKDKRFIETKDVLGKLDGQTNLASMDWQDFENLIAELFQKEFSEEGTEIKLTQSSRDKGVDAIVFNPDPIRGGKYVIQAKRYTNTVDVSAVRDLVAVVAHEGASRGILVTTSTYGADAYAFVQNKPITLLDGAKLLGLLEKHGYKFRINIVEARKLYPHNTKY